MRKNLLLAAISLIAVYFVSGQNIGISVTFPSERLQVDSGNIKIGKDVWIPTRSHLLKFGDGDFCHIGEMGDDSMEIKTRYLSIIEPYGPLAKVRIHGNLKIEDGSEGNGKILTSDNTGNTTWLSPASLNTGFNANFSTSQSVTLPCGGCLGLLLINWDTENFDDGGNLSGTTFTAPATGVYHFDVSLSFSLSVITGAGYVGIRLILPGGKEKCSITPVSTGNNGSRAGASLGHTMQMNAGDVITVYAINGTSVAQTVTPLLSSSQESCSFTGY